MELAFKFHFIANKELRDAVGRLEIMVIWIDSGVLEHGNATNTPELKDSTAPHAGSVFTI